MPVEQKNYYEGLFLFSQAVTADLQTAMDHVKEILQRADVNLISFRKWDERRLAYEVKGNRRGVFFLVYFEAPGSAIARIDRDCNLSEQVLRSMITRADNMSLEQMQAADGQEQLKDEIKLRSVEEAQEDETTRKPQEETRNAENADKAEKADKADKAEKADNEAVAVVETAEVEADDASITEDVPVTPES